MARRSDESDGDRLRAPGRRPFRQIDAGDRRTNGGPDVHSHARPGAILAGDNGDVRVLDGGLRAWVAAGNLLETEEPPAASGMPLALTAGHLPTLDADAVAAFDGTVVDVRAPERYRGEVEPIDPRAGHIPGAVNRPVGGYWTAEGTLPDEGELRGLLALPEDTPVAVYCGSGVSAAQVVLALASLGVDASLYPPSWSGWSADPSRPVAVGTQE